MTSLRRQMIGACSSRYRRSYPPSRSPKAELIYVSGWTVGSRSAGADYTRESSRLRMSATEKVAWRVTGHWYSSGPRVRTE